MALQKLFLAHYSGDADELHWLALELRLHGITPWVDKQGGFAVADASEATARRAIREDCFGMLLYASPQVFDRWFIREVEINEAKKVRVINPSFALFAVPRRLSFARLKALSTASFGIDLSLFHTVPVPQQADLDTAFAQVAGEVVRIVLQRAARVRRDWLQLQFSTRELFPDEPEDCLCINAVALFGASVADAAAWERLLKALQRVKREIAAVYGRPRLGIHGSKHLTAAFLFGRVFAPFELDIRQTADAVWTSDGPCSAGAPFVSRVECGDPGDERLFVEIASGYKNVAAGVNTLLAHGSGSRPVRLHLAPADGPLVVDAPLCRAMVEQTYAVIEQTMKAHTIREIHLFAAAPQAFVMLLGRKMKGMPDVHVYEWDGRQYYYSCVVPGAVL